MSLRAIFDKLSVPELSANLRLFYAATAQRQMLGSIDTSLVLFEAELINTANGEYRGLAQDAQQSWAEQVALAARKLLPATETTASILLLLPTSDFVATRFNLGISGEMLLKSALRLQAPNLLPAYEEPLLLALHADKPEGVALWYSKAKADELYQAFAAQNLHLAALMPRALAADQQALGQLNGQQTEASESSHVLDEDSNHVSLLELNKGALQVCLSIRRTDLEEVAFASQWQAELAKIPEQVQHTRVNKAFWTSLRAVLTARPAYCFYPSGAVNAGKKLLARKQKTAGALALAAVVLLLALPFISNWVQIAYLNRQMDEYRELSTQARESQAAVYDMEDAWGALAEYPQQDIEQVLLTLNRVIEGSLSSFSINKGVIDISGFSQDPALLIEQLAEFELFYDVGQSRSSSGGANASQGDRFGIRMNVSGIDFADYEEKFPASSQ